MSKNLAKQLIVARTDQSPNALVGSAKSALDRIRHRPRLLSTSGIGWWEDWFVSASPPEGRGGRQSCATQIGYRQSSSLARACLSTTTASPSPNGSNGSQRWGARVSWSRNMRIGRRNTVETHPITLEAHTCSCTAYRTR